MFYSINNLNEKKNLLGRVAAKEKQVADNISDEIIAIKQGINAKERALKATEQATKQKDLLTADATQQRKALYDSAMLEIKQAVSNKDVSGQPMAQLYVNMVKLSDDSILADQTDFIKTLRDIKQTLDALRALPDVNEVHRRAIADIINKFGVENNKQLGLILQKLGDLPKTTDLNKVEDAIIGKQMETIDAIKELDTNVKDNLNIMTPNVGDTLPFKNGFKLILNGGKQMTVLTRGFSGFKNNVKFKVNNNFGDFSLTPQFSKQAFELFNNIIQQKEEFNFPHTPSKKLAEQFTLLLETMASQATGESIQTGNKAISALFGNSEMSELFNKVYEPLMAFLPKTEPKVKEEKTGGGLKTKKKAASKQVAVKIFASNKELKDAFATAIAARQAGNDSPILRSQLYALADQMLAKRLMTKAQHKVLTGDLIKNNK